jgi:prepilin-type N-terminal cleavage/methylation domain-containing protein
LIRRPHHRPSHGLTLIEVLAALVIIAVLLGSVVMTQGRLTRQWAAADLTLRAIDAADELLMRWRREGDFPGEASGMLDEQLVWQTLVVPGVEADTLGAVVLRLEVFDRSHRTRQPLLVIETLWSVVGPPDDEAGDEGAAA